MRYTKDKFTEEEIKNIINVAEKVCLFLGVEIDDLLSTSRKAEIVKARVMIVHYQFHNILVKNYKFRKSYSLACWYLGKDHTTGLHSLETCEDEYRFNKQFRHHYELISFFIQNPEQLMGKIAPDKRWDNIKKDTSVSNKDKYSQMPQDVHDTIEKYLEKRYSYGYIADKVGVNDSFIDHFVMVNSIKKDTSRSYGKQVRVSSIGTQPTFIAGK